MQERQQREHSRQKRIKFTTVQESKESEPPIMPRKASENLIDLDYNDEYNFIKRSSQDSLRSAGKLTPHKQVK